MKTYRTTAVAGIAAGSLVGLSKEQAAARAHALEATSTTGVYKVTQRIEFKVGETFSLDGDLPKGLADQLEDPANPRPAADVKPTKPAAKTKAARQATE